MTTTKIYRVLRFGHGRKKPLIIAVNAEGKTEFGEGSVVGWGYESTEEAPLALHNVLAHDRKRGISSMEWRSDLVCPDCSGSDFISDGKGGESPCLNTTFHDTNPKG